MGQNPFTTIPRWYINGVSLDIEDKLIYLGSILGVNGLQGTGIKSPGVNAQTALHLFNVGVSSTLTYGCASIYINKSQLVNLDKYQVKLIKTVPWLEMSNTYYSSHEGLISQVQLSSLRWIC